MAGSNGCTSNLSTACSSGFVVSLGDGVVGGGVERGGIDTVEDDSEHWPKDLIGPIADYIKFCPYTSLW